MKNTLIFDLDGTLLNTLGDLHQSTNYSLKKFGFPEKSLEEVRKSVGNGLKNLIQRSLPYGTSAEVVSAVLAEMKAHYAQHFCDLTRPYDGIPELLQRLQAQGYAMAIVSNKADEMIQLLHRRFFADLIPVAVGELKNVPRKPSPELVELALHRLGVTRETAYYIGDSEVDIQTAKNAALPCLTVGWGFRSEESLLAAGAARVFHSPGELLEYLIGEGLSVPAECSDNTAKAPAFQDNEAPTDTDPCRDIHYPQ